MPENKLSRQNYTRLQGFLAVAFVIGIGAYAYSMWEINNYKIKENELSDKINLMVDNHF